MNDYIIAADFLSLIFMRITLLGALISSKSNRKQSTKLFIIMLICIIIAIPFDAISYMVDGVTDNDTLLKVLNLLPYILIVPVIVMFSYYVISVVREKIYVSYRTLNVFSGLSVFNIIMLIVGTVNEKLFVIVDHEFQPGEWHVTVYILTLLYMVYLSYILIKHRKELSMRLVLSLCTYLFFPFIFALGVMLFGIPDFTYATGAASLLIIYVTIQVQTIAEAELREKITNEVSRTDSLTGLKNRRSFDEFLHNNSQDRGRVVAFFDLNSLKYTNDTFGHAAGDKLIMEFADLLTENFKDGDIFRISGDEFVVSFTSLNHDDVEKRMEAFRDVIYSRNRIAAFGFVYRESENILDMVREAEQKMYKDKSLYYKETGKDRRR